MPAEKQSGPPRHLTCTSRDLHTDAGPGLLHPRIREVTDGSIASRSAENHGGIPAELKEQIVLQHTPLIRYIVNRIAVRLPSHIDLDDLQNTGVIGLMDAIDKYDPDKNCKFKTYAEFRIKGAILDQLRSLDWVPRSIRQKSRRLEQAYTEVEQRLGRSATEHEVAGSLGIELDQFHFLLNQVRGISMINLDTTDAGDDNLTTTLGVSKTFTLEVIPTRGAVLHIERTTPIFMDIINFLN